METRKQQVLVIIGSGIFLVAASITATYFLKTGRLGGYAEESGYKNVTFTDAVLTCEQEFKERYEKRIINYAMDNHSSRYENKLFTYKIFYKANLVTKQKKHGNLHYINCFVNAEDGRVSKFEIFEETETETEAVTDTETNAFGWPK